jgi:hypothetical protein
MPTIPPIERQRGQLLAVFAISLVGVVAMTGLVLDGGATFVQRRDQQNVADAAALAAAYAYGNANGRCDTSDTTTAAAAGQSIAAANGYVNGTNGVVVTVSFDASGGAGRHITVGISKPHRNAFSGIVGMPSWGVATTAMTLAGCPNTVLGAMPIIFNQDALTTNGTGPSSEHIYGEPPVGGEDVPIGTATFNWTMYCDFCNADSSTVSSLIRGEGYQTEVTLDDTIAPLNAGSHATLYDDLAVWVGQEFPIPLVDDDGKMVGWAMFHITGSSGGSTKEIRGYFVSPINPSSMTIRDGVSGGVNGGAYTVQLVN